MKNINDAREIFINFLKKKNLKITNERKRVLDEIYKIKEHFDAENLFFKFKKDGINVSRATIYRTLDLLVESGLLSKIRFSDNTYQYEPILGQEHHSHLICIKCGKIEEFVDERLDSITEEIGAKFGYRNVKHNFRIYGLCFDCSKSY